MKKYNIGTATPQDLTSQEKAISFFVKSAISKFVITSCPAKVIEVDTKNKLLRVQPLIDEVVIGNKSQERAPIEEVPYMQLSSGKFLIDCPPVAGDVGTLCMAFRDISRLKKNWEHATPETSRSHSWNDAICIAGSIKAGNPKHIIKIDQENGFTFQSDHPIFFESDVEFKSNVKITGNTSINGKLSVEQDVKIGGSLIVAKDIVGNGVSLMSHIHSVTSAPGTTGKPE